MNTPKTEQLIENSAKLKTLFGFWPSFHDAEITELHFDRGGISEAKDIWDFPVLTAKIMLFENPQGMDDARPWRPTLAVLQFRNIAEFSMQGFNYQNSLYTIELLLSPKDERWEFAVSFDSAFGMRSNFKCSGIAVLNAVPWNQDERPPRWLTSEHLARLELPPEPPS